MIDVPAFLNSGIYSSPSSLVFLRFVHKLFIVNRFVFVVCCSFLLQAGRVPISNCRFLPALALPRLSVCLCLEEALGNPLVLSLLISAALARNTSTRSLPDRAHHSDNEADNYETDNDADEVDSSLVKNEDDKEDKQEM